MQLGIPITLPERGSQVNPDKMNKRLEVLLAIAGVIGAIAAIIGAIDEVTEKIDKLLKTFGHKGIIPVPEEENDINNR